MTLDEMLMMPVGMTIEEWKAELKRRKTIKKKIGKLSIDIDFEVDALTVLKDEIGSERWMKHNSRMYTLIAKRDRLLKESEEW